MTKLLRIIYKPEGGSRQEWEVDLQNPAWDLHKAAPKAAGFRGWLPFQEALENVDADAWQAMIWALRRRRETRLSFDSVDFPSGLVNEVAFATQCPDCKEWLSTEDDGTEGAEGDEHDCPAHREDESVSDDAAEGEEPGEA